MSLSIYIYLIAIYTVHGIIHVACANIINKINNYTSVPWDKINIKMDLFLTSPFYG